MKKWLTSLENSDVPNTVHQRRALISRNLDFWLLGGFSIFSLVFLFILKSIFSIELMSILQFSLLLLVLKIGIEFPHLLASYKIAYSQGRNFILNHWAVLLLVPLFLIVAFFLIIFSNQKFYTYAQNIIQWLVCAVFFLLGWHRSMQTYGCMIVYSRYDSYELSRLQRSYIKFFLLII